MKRAAVIIVWTFAAEAAGAETWLVLPDGSGDAPTIHAAVDSAATGDEVVLGNGTFSGWANSSWDFDGKAITVRSTSGDPTQCIIDCDGNGGVSFWKGEGPSSILEGVHIMSPGGYSPSVEGSAIYCEGTSPIIRNVVVTEARFGILSLNGGSPRFENVRIEASGLPAFHAEFSTPTITGSVIASNVSEGTGGWGAAVYLVNSDATIENCHIEGNQHGGFSLHSSDATIANCRIEGNLVGAMSMSQSSPLIRDCVIVGNVGEYGGIYMSASFPTIERCTITRNYGSLFGGGLTIRGGSTAALDRTIVWGNCAIGPGEDIHFGGGSVANATCSDIRRSRVAGLGTLNAGPDVIDVPPNFCDPNDCTGGTSFDGDYTVDDDSPVVTAPCGMMGALAANCTIHVERTSWGAIKALYR